MSFFDCAGHNVNTKSIYLMTEILLFEKTIEEQNEEENMAANEFIECLLT